MARVTLAEIQGWVDPIKLTLASIDTELLANIETETLAKVATVYDTTTWLDVATTPKLIRTAISKYYASWIIDRMYSENQDEGSDYAKRLCDNADSIIIAILERTIIIPEVPADPTSFSASYYPNDASSAQTPTADNPSLGGPYFSLGRTF
jgi:hypothetical protein